MNSFDFYAPNSLKKIINTIESAGYTAWCVGGCVRDAALKQRPFDYDIATSMPPEKAFELFDKVIPTGIKHGTVTILEDGIPYEVTRYRIDGEYLDHRKPTTVEFTDDFLLDLSRRDFTVNAMGYSFSRGIFDPYNALADIEKKVIRTVGNPKERFLEDALRIMRGVRFRQSLVLK